MFILLITHLVVLVELRSCEAGDMAPIQVQSHFKHGYMELERF